jgi:hypothetical protein
MRSWFRRRAKSPAGSVLTNNTTSKELNQSKVAREGKIAEQQTARPTSIEQSVIETRGGQVQNCFENRENVVNQAGQQIIHGNLNINQSV